MYVVPMEAFLELREMRPHEDLVAAGLVVEWDGNMPVNFISHQWLSYGSPDPGGVQLQSAQAMFREVIAGEDPFKTPEDWKRYSERWDYTGGVRSRRRSSVTQASASSTKADLQQTIEVVGIDDFRNSVTNGCVWLDYASIPQLGSGNDFRAAQGRAIKTIPYYVGNATNFWVVAPPCVHEETGATSDLASWQKRGWCRLEGWINELSLQAFRPLCIEQQAEDGGGISFKGCKVTVEDFSDKLTHRALAKHAVLRGEFSCCKFGHVVDGETISCDKVRIAAVLRDAYDDKLRHLERTGDVVNHAWFLCLRPSLLAGGGEVGLPEATLPPDETMASFLSRYGWRGEGGGPEGEGLPAQAVFFPLFCASTEGNLPVVRALLDAKADPRRRLLGAGTSSLEAAALCGHAEVVTVLLDAGADINGCSQFDGATALHKAAKGEAAVVVELLLKRGADAARKDHGGETSEDVAAAVESMQELLQLFTQFKAESSAP